jgi:hypothetical protein
VAKACSLVVCLLLLAGCGFSDSAQEACDRDHPNDKAAATKCLDGAQRSWLGWLNSGK